MDEEKKPTEPAEQEETAEAAAAAAEATRRAELEEVARRVVNEERERWEGERRRRKCRIRRWGAGIVALLLVAAALWFLLPGSRSESIVVNEETIPGLSPIDEEAAAAIDAMAGYSPDDTWTFYLYWVGSNLEAGNSNQLSDLVKMMIEDEAAEIAAEASRQTHERFLQLSEEIAEKGLELPYYLFAPQSDLYWVDSGEEDIYVQGDASQDLWEYMSVPLPENVKFVIQTGGSPAWAEPDVNPNRTQRFVLDSQGLREVYNGPISNMGDPDTLADFLKFGTKEYPADHKVVILWDHGGADLGFGEDMIYGDGLTLPELREAFSAAFPPDREEPPLELIYFACCLMSNAEVLDYLDGTARYMVAAEEVTYTVPTACSGWLEKFVENTGINGAQLGRLMVDAYMDAVLGYAEQSSYLLPTTMNLLDMRRAGDVYEAYGEFARAALQAQIKDPGMISVVADAAASSVFMAGVSYSHYNLIDLTIFMESAAKYFPKEAGAVIDAVEDVMLYKRATEYLRAAGGISVYYPYHLESSGAIGKCLNYISSVSDNMDINAMYYYKMTGCLNDSYLQHCEDEGYGTAETLRYDELYRLRNVEVEADESGEMSLSLTEVESLLLQDAVYELMMLEDDMIVYLGEDRYVVAEEDRLYTDFPLSWVSIDGVPFALEIINTDDENIQYRTPVEYRSMDMYLVLNYNYETEKTTVLGIRDCSLSADTLDRGVEPLEAGEKISPIYIESDLSGASVYRTAGKSVRYDGPDDISETKLQDGTYIARIRMEDMRSDQYYGQAIRFEVKNGRVKEVMPETECRPAALR